MTSRILDIGSRRQLFIDERFIERSQGIRLRMNPPVQHPDPVLVPDRPWEAFRRFPERARTCGDRRGPPDEGITCVSPGSAAVSTGTRCGPPNCHRSVKAHLSVTCAM